MDLGKVILVSAVAASVSALCDRPFAIRCGRPGIKETAIKAQSLANRLQSGALAENRCPSTSDLGKDDVDSWNQPFRISCEQDERLMVVVTSVGRDGILGTADDIHRYGELAQDAGAAGEGMRDGGPNDQTVTDT